MNKLQVLRVNNPFDRNDKDYFYKDFYCGDTISTIITDVFPIGVEFTVSINGVVVKPEDYAIRTVFHGDYILLVPTIHGGDGNKGILRAIAMIAIAVVSYGVGTAIAGSMGLAAEGSASFAFGAATWQGGALAIAGSVATNIVGGMLLNAMTPKLKTNEPLETSAAYGWNPVNTQQQGLAINCWYGEYRVRSANIIASYIHHDGDANQTLNALLHYGLGPIQSISDYRLNKQPVIDILNPGVRLGKLNQTAFSNFEETKIEYANSSLVEAATPVSYLTIGNDFDFLEVDIVFPSGLYYLGGDGVKTARVVDVQVEMRTEGGVWGVVSEGIVSTLTTVVGTSYWSAGYWTTQYLEWGHEPHWREVEIGTTTFSAHTDGEFHSTVVGKEVLWRWMPADGVARAFVDSTSAYLHFNDVYDKPITFTQRYKTSSASKYEVRVTRLTADSADTLVVDTVYFGNVREIIAEKFTYPRQALVNINALATEQINTGFEFDALINGKLVWTYNGSTWTFGYSTNPAWICYDILTQPVTEDNYTTVARYDGLAPSSIDTAKFYEWAQFCDELVDDGAGGTEPRFEFHGGFDSVTNVWEAALKVAEMSRAFLLWHGSIVTVTLDKATSPSQMFTVGNQGVDSFEEVFLPEADRASGIEFDFTNREEDYERSKIILHDPSINNPSNKLNIQYLGVTKPSQAWRTAKYLLNQNKYIKSTVNFDADIDAIACNVGDVVLLQHDVPEWGEGGRIVSATSSSVILDKEVTLESGNTYTVLIRLSDDSTVEKTVAAVGETTVTATLALTTTFTTVPSQYDIYSFGIVDQHYKKYRVGSISITSEQKATISAFEYDENIYSTITTPDITTYPAIVDKRIADVSNIILTEERKFTNNIAVHNILGSYTRPNDSKFDKVFVFYRNTAFGNYILSGTSNTGSFVISGISSNSTYEVVLVSANKFGQHNEITLSPSAQITTTSVFSIDNNPYILAGPSGLSVAFGTDLDCYLYWDDFNAAWSPSAWFKHFRVEIRDLDTYVLRSSHITKVPSFTYTFEQNTIDTLTADIEIRVYTVDVWGNESPASTTIATHELPDAPTEVLTKSVLFGIDVTVDYVRDNAFNYVELYFNSIDDNSTATLLATFTGNFYAHSNLGTIESFYYWAKTRNKFGQVSAFNATGGTLGTTDTDPTSLLDVLTGELTEDQLATSLSSRIDLIDAPTTGLVDSVDQVESDLAGLQSQVNSLAGELIGTVFVQPGEPVPGVDGVPDPIPANSRWYDSDDDNHPYLWYDSGSGEVWQSLRDPRIAENAADIVILDTALTNAEGDIATNASAISALDTTVISLAGTVTAIAADVTQLETDLATTDGNVSSNTSAISALDTRVVVAENTIVSHSSDITSLQTDMTSAEGDIVSNTSAISGLDTRVTSAEGSITSQAGDITSLDTRVTANEVDISGQSTAISGLNTRVTLAEGTITAHGSDITQLQTDITAAEGDISGNATAISGLDTRVTSAEGAIVTNSSDITALDSRVTTNEGGISGNSIAISGLDTRVTSAEGNITSQASDITSLQSAVTTAEGNISGNASAISSLDTRVTSAEGTISAHSSSITQIESDVDDNAAAISVEASTRAIGDNLAYAEYAIKLDVNGHIAGIGVAVLDGVSGPTTGEVVVVADIFKVVNPSLPSDIAQVFTVGTINGSPAVGVEGDLIIDGSISARSIITSELIVGDNITMGPDAEISWSKVTDDGNKPDDGADVTDYSDYRVSNSQAENGVTTIANPQGGTYTSSTVTGAIKITLPQSWTNTMMKFEVDVFLYSSTEPSFKLLLGGYNYAQASLWNNEFAQILGNTGSNNRVRFGHDGSKCCVVIGETTSVWYYPKIAVKNFQAGHTNYAISQWEAGWNVSVVTDISGITFTGDISDALLDAKSILGQGALATVSAADWGTQVAGTGKPADNADVTTDELEAGVTLTLAGSGLYLGKSSYTDTATGIFLGRDIADNVPKFHIGSTTHYLKWTGTSLDIRGNLTADDIQSGGNIDGVNITGSTLTAGSASGQHVDITGDGETVWYDTDGTTKLCTIGLTTEGSDPNIILMTSLVEKTGIRVSTNNDSAYGAYFHNSGLGTTLKVGSGSTGVGLEVGPYGYAPMRVVPATFMFYNTGFGYGGGVWANDRGKLYNYQLGTTSRWEPLGPLAFVNFDGTSVGTRRRESMISTITDYGVGYYGINFNSPLPHNDYIVVGTAQYNGADSSPGVGVYIRGHATSQQYQTTTQVRITTTLNPASGSANYDSNNVMVAIF